MREDDQYDSSDFDIPENSHYTRFEEREEDIISLATNTDLMKEAENESPVGAQDHSHCVENLET